MKIYLLTIALIFCSIQMFSQEDDGVVSLDLPVRNSLTFNRYLINPTFSFVREQNRYISITNKREYTQFEDAPTTYMGSYSGRLKENIGVGLGLFQENYGVLTTFGGILNFAYNARIQRDNNLTFGLNLGVYNSGVNTGRVVTNFQDPSLENVPSNLVLTVNPGINYGLSFLDFGVSINNLVLYNVNTSELIQDDPQQSIQAHVMHTGLINASGFFDESKFSALAKTEFGKDQTIISGLAMLTVPKGIWAQVGYNTLYGASAGVGLNITQSIAVEYNYEQAIGDLMDFGSSHEISLAFRFQSKERYRYNGDEEVAGLLSSNKKKVKRPTSKIDKAQAEANRQAAQERRAEAKKDAEAKAITNAEAEAQAENTAQLEAEEAQAKLEAQKQAEIEIQNEIDKALKAEEALRAEAEKAKAKAAAEEQAKLEAQRQAEIEIQNEIDKALKAEEALRAEAEKAKAKAAAEEQAKLEAQRQAEIEIQNEIDKALKAEEALRAEAEKAKAIAAAEEQAKLEAQRQAEIEIQNEIDRALKAEEALRAEAEKAQAIAEAEEQAKLEAQRQAEIEIQNEIDRALREEAEAIAAAQKQTDQNPNPSDALGQSMVELVEQTDNAKAEQQDLLKRLSDAVAVKDQDLKDLKKENDLSEQGVVTPPKEFKSVTAENNAIEALKSELDQTIAERSKTIEELEEIYNERIKIKSLKNDEVSLFYKNKIERLKAEQAKAIEAQTNLTTSLADIKIATEIERKRRIKRAVYDSDADRYAQDRTKLKVIKQTTALSNEPLTSEDFDFGEEQSGNIQILKNVQNVEAGYYVTVAVHNDVNKRDEFIKNMVASGESDVDFFYDVNTSKYYIYYQKFNSVDQANKALEAKGSLPYNEKMSIVKIEN
ncbi:PorP/SprF family type IX secretion system membrane protein [Sediminibacter sp. Hel_I_10]|uniref:PorP/SprF family type IX secretion system membrane protein n=1 Tax=Sediminibacter sp. Hel_I_10 TaxID=1392490 RepID=UPI00047E8107|nr:PorP/SprF family type IX secretion system membrane protein [Sediminibacter sp. Hel_I_10]